jgi:V8-like Glu-specific endopeptidase
VRGNQKILNFARDDLSKNASTKKPAILFRRLCPYIKSIGRISCGEKAGTCWLVTDMLVITCHHVYMSFMEEREHTNNPHLPIEVLFDYFEPGKPERIRKVEVDEERDPQLESSHLDYKVLRLKECEALKDREGLGPIVRNRLLQDGLVVIVGHPGGSEMHEETCVVVSNHSWREILKQRGEKCERRNEEFQHNADLQISPGVHMTNDDLLRSANRYQEQGCLPYDTTLFSGASGSPVFDLNGNIVAMHTHGYRLDVEGEKYSLMEFGVQFSAICENLRERNLLEQFFPNYDLEHHEERMIEG